MIYLIFKRLKTLYHFGLYQGYSATIARKKEPIDIHSLFVLFKLIMKKCSTRIVFFCILTLLFATAHSQENTSQTLITSTEAPNSPELKQLNKTELTENNIDDLSIALSLITQGDSYYQQKHYDDAIVQYIDATKYLSALDQATQKRLGETYKQIAQSYKRTANREQVALFYKRALKIFTAIQDRKLMARTLNTLAEAERYLGNYVVALDYSTRGLEIHKELDDDSGRIKALVGAGIIYRHIGRYEKSLSHIYEAHQYYKKVNDANGIAKTSNQMGLIYTRLKEFTQARSFYQRTIDLPSNQIDAKTLASALREIAVIDLNAGDYESAKAIATKANEIYQRIHDKPNESLITRIIANIYRAQKNTTKAIPYYRKSLSIAIEIDHKIYQLKAQVPLAGILIGQNTDEAVSLLESALELATKTKATDHQLYIYRALRKAKKSQKKYEESLFYSEKEIFLTKVIQEEKDNKEFLLIKAKLHSHKMEMEVASLKEITELAQLELTKKNSEIEIAGQARIISELELAKNQYASIALASLLAICLLAVIFTYRRFVHSKRHNRELNYLADRDPLTNCYNRRFLDNILKRDFADLRLLDEYCIILADIDHFKAVNDTYGHSTGDSVIRGVANILQTNVRQNDVLARFGGEEFCIVLPNTTHVQAMRISETIRKKIEASRFDDIAVTCSFGIACIKFDAKTPTEFVDQADLALYKSKSLGRNQVTLWSQSLED